MKGLDDLRDHPDELHDVIAAAVTATRAGGAMIADKKITTPSARELGRQDAQSSRAEQGLPTPTEDFATLRILVGILDHLPGESHTTKKRARTAQAKRTSGCSTLLLSRRERGVIP